MSAVEWGAVLVAAVLGVVAVVVAVWRRRFGPPLDDLVIERAEVVDDARATDLAFDRIVGHLLRSDPGFADDTSRLRGHDDAGPAA